MDDRTMAGGCTAKQRQIARKKADQMFRQAPLGRPATACRAYQPGRAPRLVRRI